VIVNLVILPLTFISGIFFPTDTMPKVVLDAARLFPIRALADALQYAFDPRTTGAGINWTDLRTLAIWTAIGVALMVRRLCSPCWSSRRARSRWAAETGGLSCSRIARPARHWCFPHRSAFSG
jgi:hypothetical protein